MYVLQLQSQYEFITFHNYIQLLTLLTKLLTFMLNLGQQRKTTMTSASASLDKKSQAAALGPSAPAAPMNLRF